MYAVVAAPDKKEQIMNLIGDTVVFNEFSSFDQVGLKGVFEKVLRIPLNTLIIDAAAGPEEELVNAVKTYRMRRPSTRVVLLAPGKVPGDRLVASLVHKGVFDIIASEVWPERLKDVLEQPPADYSVAARWDVQNEENESGEVNRNSILNRFGNTAEHILKSVKRNKKEENTYSKDNEENSVTEGFSSVPQDFASLDDNIGATFYPDVKKLCEADPIPSAVLLSADRTDLLETIKALRRVFKLLSVPVVVVGNCNTPACYSAGADECVESLDDQAVKLILSRASRMKELWSRTVKDDLTGLYKRLFLDNYLNEQEKRHREAGVTFSIIMADLDHFKRINDTYGHQAGDSVLKEFSQFLLSSVRQSDIAARYGGEEFIIVLPGVQVEQAKEIADKLRKTWEATSIKLPDGKKLKSTFSVGVAEYDGQVKKVSALIKECDKALYAAKAAGRNRVKMAGEISISSTVMPEEEKLNKKSIWPIKLTFLNRNKQGNIIVVISGEGAGKTTISVNLAVTLALQGKTVGFIDGDLESLAAHGLIGGVPSGKSLLYALENPSEANEFLETVPFVPQLYSLTSDPIVEINLRLFSKLPDVIRKVASGFDTVVVDTPPDPKSVKKLAKIADRVVLVVTSDITLDDYEGIKIPHSVLLLNCWPPDFDVSLGEELCGIRASGVIPILNEVLEAERGGVPAVLGCSRLYQTMSSLVDLVS